MSFGELWLFVGMFALGSTLGYPVVGPFSIIVGVILAFWSLERSRSARDANFWAEQGMSQRERMCMRILRADGFDARADNQRAWSRHCERVLRTNAMGNYIGYTEFNRSEARREHARRNF